MELGEIEAGKYIIHATVDWNDDIPEEDRFFNVTSYGVEGVSFDFFSSRDVVRHPLVQRIVDAYDQHERDSAQDED